MSDGQVCAPGGDPADGLEGAAVPGLGYSGDPTQSRDCREWGLRPTPGRPLPKVAAQTASQHAGQACSSVGSNSHHSDKWALFSGRLVAALALVSFWVGIQPLPLRAAQPNIVLILADDMGWGDDGYHGFSDIITPSIDRIAREGVWFSQGYVTASVCAPSRAGLLSGRYQQRFGMGENPSATVPRSKGVRDQTEFSTMGLPPSQPILAETLKAKGYTTGIVGKWHLGAHPTMRPNARGFDFFYGFLNGAHSYTEWTDQFVRQKGRWPIFRNEMREPPQNDVYLTDLFSDEAVDFIERSVIGNQEAAIKKPFFLYLSYNAVHGPWQVPDRYLERTKHLTDSENRNFFAAMVLVMDDGVGRVYQALKKHSVLDNTALIFISDNGTPRHQGLKPNRKESNGWERMPGEDYMSTPGALRGFKGDTYEGGIRVPFCIRWPGKIKAGTRYDLPVIALDVFPTLLPDAKSEGVDLLPYLSGDRQGRPHDLLYWRRDNDYAVREGDWKLTWNDASGSANIMLFNLANDPGELHDLAARHPAKAQAMQELFDE